jgi:hypothetical protein
VRARWRGNNEDASVKKGRIGETGGEWQRVADAQKRREWKGWRVRVVCEAGWMGEGREDRIPPGHQTSVRGNLSFPSRPPSSMRKAEH